MIADTSKNSFWVRVEKLSVIICYYELSDGVPWIVDNRMDGTKFQVFTASQPSSHPDKVCLNQIQMQEKKDGSQMELVCLPVTFHTLQGNCAAVHVEEESQF